MIGFSSDIFAPQKLKSFERKISDDEEKLGNDEIFDLAQSFYNDNIKIINKTNITSSKPGI